MALAESDAADSAGAFGKYQLIAKIGTGGQGEVYLALARGPTDVNKIVVIKKLRPHLQEQSEWLQMFLDEARLATRLNHPNIVHTFEAGELDGAYYMAMEYLDGQPLQRVVRAARALPQPPSPAFWVRVCAMALRGLQYAHELRDYDGTPLGIVHRDVSPHNVFVTFDGQVKLVDFGIAKAALNTTETETGVLKGKLAYMAPEQAGGRPDQRSDLFSMGAVLWEIFADRKLFEGDAMRVLHRLVNDPIPRLSSIVPSIDPALDDLLAKALARSPDERFQTAEEMGEALDAFVEKSGERVSDTQLARMMKALFQDTRETLQKQIQAAIANSRAASTTASLQTLTLSSSVPSLPVLPSMTGSDTPSFIRTSATGSVTHTEGRKRSPLLLAAVAVVGFGLAAFVWLRRSDVRTEPVAPSSAVSSPPAAAQMAKLELVSNPPGADIDWNGTVIGQTPKTVELPAGSQAITLRKGGFEAVHVALDLAAGEQRSRAFVLSAVAQPAAPSAAPVDAAKAPVGKKVANAPAKGGAAATNTAAPATAAPPPPPAAPPSIKAIDEGPKIKAL